MIRHPQTRLSTIAACALAAALGTACSDTVTGPAARPRSSYVTGIAVQQRCLSPATSDPTFYDGYLYPQDVQYLECLPIDPPPLIPIGDRPVFYDGASVEATVETRNDAPIETLVQYEQGQGYQSLRAYLDSNEWTEATAAAGGDGEAATGSEGIAQANDGVTRDDFDFGDGILSLLNNRGEIQVGDTVYKLTRDNAYAVHVRDLALLRELVPTLSSPAPAPDYRIVAQPVETTATGDSLQPALARTAGVETGFSLGFTTDHCTWQNGSRRMKGKSYITSAFFYSEAGVRTDWERKKLFWWSNTWQSGTLEYAYSTASLRLGNNYIFPTSGSGFQTGTSSVHKVIKSGWFKQIRGTINGTHTSSIGQCYTRVTRN
ncbi:MAG TPA: hypothetical protein VFE05_11355 [Longimicrobiaceae bacterium]|jgi:hypothetical protein|nr:hypothetical protein [Longimicrobiaceae bacterium]